MFRDREKALQELQKQLLEDESEDLPEEEWDEEDPEKGWDEEDPEEEWDDAELPQEVYDDYARNVHVYNTDTTDTDLDEYSEEIYAEPRKRTGCALWLALATAALLLALSYFLAKQGGLL